MDDVVTIRPATEADLTRVAYLAGQLVRMHHATDPGRFLLVDNVEDGYAWWLGREIKRADAVVLVAARGEAIAGYAYGSIEERDWNMLLDTHGALHDVFVAPESRRSGVGRKLVEAMITRLEEKGAPRVVLSTMVANDAAQKIFGRCGFRPTMIEMTRNKASD